MLICKTIATGSSGNCYELMNDNEILLLDLGVSAKVIKKAIDFRISDVVGAVVSHTHLDHAKSVKDFENMGIPIFAPYRSLEPMSFKDGSQFKVQAFDLTDKNGKFMHTNNDGSECSCYGFLIEHEDMGKLLYITDTEFVKWRFSGINHILLGVNYSNNLITDSAKRNHVLRGHMSIDTACDFVRNNNKNLRNVIMCHLSEENSDEDMFLDKMKKCFNGECFIAKRGLEIPLCLTPF